MKSLIKYTSLFNRKYLSQMRSISVLSAVSLVLVLCLILLAVRDWQQPTLAQESSRATENIESINSLPGDLDLTFGVDGTVQIDLGNNREDSASAVAVQPDGKVVTVGYVSSVSAGKDFAVTRLNPDGTLDTAFGNNGKLSFNFFSASRNDIARAVAIQQDGKIVIAGEADVSGFGNFDFALARLNFDGTLDTSFGSNGKVTTNLPNNRPDYGRSIALQQDGKILVAGYSNRSITGDDFVVVRYNTNGSLDTSFNGSGIVTTDILTNRTDRASSIALQTDGKVVVAGFTNSPSFGNDFAVVRYNTNGSLDTNFNGTGKVNTDLNLNSSDFGNAVTLQSDGKVVVAGESSSDFGLVRYNTNGSLDTTFGGGDGITTTNFGSGAVDTARGVIVQSTGKIIVAGRSRTELALARYNPDGTLDNTFDNDGLIVQNAGNNQLSPFGGYWGIALQSDDKIVAAGDGWRDFSSNDFTVSRLNSNGTFDFTFGGGDGIASTDINKLIDEVTDVAIQSDGKIVAVGGAQNSTGGYDFAVTRYNPNGTLDTSFGNNGIVITDILGNSIESGQALAIQPDGKILIVGQTSFNGNVRDGALIRYNPNGTLDSTFGSGGIAIFPGGLIYPRDMKLQPDGKTVVVGQSDLFSVPADGFVARFNPNGSFDATFAGGGFLSFQFGNNYVYNDVNAVKLQPDGKIVIVGLTNISSNGGPGHDLAIARLNTNGSFDTSFDDDGKVTTDFGNNTADVGNDLDIQPDGKIIAVGQTDINLVDMAVARYNPNGSLDTTFGGGDGKLNIDFNTWVDVASGVAVQPDGKIILGGYADLERNFGGFALVRLTPSGAFDTSFGNGTGRLITNLGEGVNVGLGYAIQDLTLQPDGKIILAGGVSFNSTNRDFTLIRYEGVGQSCTYSFNPTSSDVTSAGGNGSFTVTSPTGCNWMATSNADWITTNSAGSGNGTVNFTVAPNTGAARTGTITVGDQTFTVNQAMGLPPSCVPAPPNLVSWWRAEGNASDFLGTHNGTLQGGATFATGKVGQAFNLTSSTDYVDLGNWFNLSEHSIAMWVNAGSTQPTFADIIDNNHQASTNWVLQQDGSNTNSYVFGDTAAVSFNLSANTWHFFTATRTNNTLRVYIDGVLQGEQTGLNPINYNGQQFFRIGRWGGGNDRNWNGLVDELDVYNRALSVTEIQSIYNAGSAGKCSCSYSLNPSSTVVSPLGGNSSFNITSLASCAWTAVSNAPWITTTSSGSGNGTVNFTVATSTGAARTGTITVGGQIFTVNQLASDGTTTVFDFEGDGKTDISIFRPSNGQWWYQQSSDGVVKVFTFGTSTDKIVPSDYDGDGKTDVALWRPSTGEWFVLRSSNNTFFAAPFGTSGDTPAPGDFDADGKTDFAVFRPSNTTWFILRTSDSNVQTVPFGLATDIPTVADYDGDGKDDVGIFRPIGGSGSGEWWLLRSTSGLFATQFGSASDKPVQGDYTGDGKADIAFFRPSTGEWFVLRSEDLTFYAAPFGSNGDTPVAGDYDGDGKFDLAVFRPSSATWFVLKSTGGTLIQGFGSNGDIPVPSAFVP